MLGDEFTDTIFTMESIFQTSDLIFYAGKSLEQIIYTLGPFTYILLFLIIFLETGLIITYFLPGDSLIFLVGAFAGAGQMNLIFSYFAILTGAILGDNLNYWIGRKIGPRVFKKENSKVFNKKYLYKTHNFYQKHGSKTIVFARFIPIVRTFAPFVAGIGTMNYKTFLTFNIIGAFIWVTLIFFLGYFLGSQPIVRDNFEFIIIFILGLFTVIFSFQYIKNRYKDKKSKKIETTSYEDLREIFKEEDTKKS